MLFPGVDPIPLPAPVWLMKALSLLTLTLHFIALQLFLGGLLAACALNFLGGRQNGPARAAFLSASLALSRRLPVVMTYVINFGIPPLLFAQVLYGRALYTSSVLIGVLWIAVIPILTFAYFFLYRMTDRIEKGRAGWTWGLAALLLTLTIGQIYAFNMTLMLRPDVWQEMYSRTALGLQTPPRDPTMAPRFLFVLAGGLTLGGLGLVLVSLAKSLSADVRSLLSRVGSVLSVVGAGAQIALAFVVQASQPEGIIASVNASPLFLISGIACLVGLALVLATSLLGLTGKGGLLAPIGGALGAVVAVAGQVIYRDGIRDVTLLSKGFDVWQREVVSNWSVIALFLLLLVAGLGVIGWLAAVALRAAPRSEAAPVEPVVFTEEALIA
ncbi:MAG: hypothetical protein SFU56_22340 [Capsulimonadales bacterium]|nr:hypothetical protein [Capsulimonadales bacterium]